MGQGPKGSAAPAKGAHYPLWVAVPPVLHTIEDALPQRGMGSAQPITTCTATQPKGGTGGNAVIGVRKVVMLWVVRWCRKEVKAFKVVRGAIQLFDGM